MTEVEALLARIEIDRLSAELVCAPASLAGLRSVPAAELTHLRRSLAEGLAGRHDEAFRAFASASGLLPAALAARITRRIIGPTLAGRIAAVMPDRRTAAITAALDVEFLADTCRTLAPPVAARMVPVIPTQTIVEVSAELVRRGDHTTLGRFVSAVDDPTLTAVLEVLQGARDLLLAGAATDDGAALDRVITLLSPARRASVIAAAPTYPDEALSILVRVDARSRALLAAAVADLPDDEAVDVLDAVISLARAHPSVRAWAVSLPTDELAAGARAFDRTDALRSAVGRLAMTVLTATETHDPDGPARAEPDDPTQGGADE